MGERHRDLELGKRAKGEVSGALAGRQAWNAELGIGKGEDHLLWLRGVNLGMRNCGSKEGADKKVNVNGGVQFGNPSTNIEFDFSQSCLFIRVF